MTPAQQQVIKYAGVPVLIVYYDGKWHVTQILASFDSKEEAIEQAPEVAQF